MPKLFNIRGPKLKLSSKGLKLTKPSARIGRKAGVNISSQGVSSSIRTKAGTVNSKDGCSLRLFGILLIVISLVVLPLLLT